MSGTGWQSSDLLARFNRMAGRPPADAIGDPVKYIFLADAQDAVITKIAGIVGKAMYGAPTAMTTADSGLTWTFGTDGNGYPLVPLSAHVYPSLNSIPDYPLNPGQDYLDEGSTIRMMNSIPYTGTLYWQGITPPQQISATVQPILMPPPARILIAIKAVEIFADEADRNPDLSDRMEVRWAKEFPDQMTLIRKHFKARHYSGISGRSWGAPLRLGA